MEIRSRRNRYSEGFWLLAGPAVVVAACAIRLSQGVSGAAAVVLAVLMTLALVGTMLIWRELRRRWQGQNAQILGRALHRVEQEKWWAAASVALWISIVSIVLRWPVGRNVIAGILLTILGFSVLVWVLAARIDARES
jgi:hypothetical protein